MRSRSRRQQPRQAHTETVAHCRAPWRSCHRAAHPRICKPDGDSILRRQLAPRENRCKSVDRGPGNAPKKLRWRERDRSRPQPFLRPSPGTPIDRSGSTTATTSPPVTARCNPCKSRIGSATSCAADATRQSRRKLLRDDSCSLFRAKSLATADPMNAFPVFSPVCRSGSARDIHRANTTCNVGPHLFRVQRTWHLRSESAQQVIRESRSCPDVTRSTAAW